MDLDKEILLRLDKDFIKQVLENKKEFNIDDFTTFSYEGLLPILERFPDFDSALDFVVSFRPGFKSSQEYWYLLKHFTGYSKEKYLKILNSEVLDLSGIKRKTKEICEIAVQKYGSNLQFVPKKYKTKKICKLAVQQNGWAIEFVPEYLMNEIGELAVQQNGWALEYIPIKFRTEKMCEIAVSQNGFLLNYVPRKLRTTKLCELAVQQNGEFLSLVPKKLRTLELCKIAVQKNAWNVEYVPKEFRKYF